MALTHQILAQRTSVHFVAHGMIGALPFRHGFTVWIEFQRSCVPALHVGVRIEFQRSCVPALQPCVGRVLLIVQASVIAVGDSVSIAVGGIIGVFGVVALLLFLVLVLTVRGDA
jgi:hypothetical protein